jgi:UDP-N-acetylglucosamine:LPS N-acetylglucosamine transferase
VVLEAGFGDFCKDPNEIAREVACWLQDEDLLSTMSRRADAMGHPSAAAEIVEDIGSITLAWMEINAASNNGIRRSILESPI